MNKTLSAELIEYFEERGIPEKVLDQIFHDRKIEPKALEKLIHRNKHRSDIPPNIAGLNIGFGHLQIINRILPRIKKALCAFQKEELVSKLHLSEFPTGEYNACAVKLRSGYGILINSGSFSRFSKLSRLATSAIKCVQFDSDGPYIFDGLKERFFASQTGIFFLVLDQFSLVESRIISRESIDVFSYYRDFDLGDLTIREQLVLGLDLSIVLHEVAHVLLGHLDQADSAQMLTVEGVAIEVPLKSRRQEFEADALAIDLGISICGSVESVMQYCNLTKTAYEKFLKNESPDIHEGGAIDGHMAPDAYVASSLVCLYMADLLSHYAKVHLGYDERNSTHPAPIDRIDAILAYLSKESMYARATIHDMPLVNLVRHWIAVSRPNLFTMIDRKDELKGRR
jgi:hypothetical protein